MDEDSLKLESLVALLDQPEKAQMRRTVDALIVLLQAAPHLAARLEAILVETEEKRRWPIAYVLAHLPQPSVLSLEVLFDTLGTEDPDIRWAVTLLLVRLGKNNPQLVELLLSLLRTGSSTQRRMAIYCLRELDVKGNRLQAAFLQAFHDAEPLVRVAAVTAFRKRPEIGREAVLSLIGTLFHDADSRVQCAAAITLAQLGEPVNTIRTALEEAREGGTLEVRRACQMALELLQKKEPVPPTR